VELVTSQFRWQVGLDGESGDGQRRVGRVVGSDMYYRLGYVWASRTVCCWGTPTALIRAIMSSEVSSRVKNDASLIYDGDCLRYVHEVKCLHELKMMRH
jgi:hypothetical protein